MEMSVKELLSVGLHCPSVSARRGKKPEPYVATLQPFSTAIDTPLSTQRKAHLILQLITYDSQKKLVFDPQVIINLS
jgi:hypothetical protein